MSNPNRPACSTRTAHGFTWSYTDDDGAQIFQRRPNPAVYSFEVMRCLPEDLENGNFEYFAQHGLTNTNKMPRKGRKGASK